MANCLVELKDNRAVAETYGTAVHQGLTDQPETNLTVGFRFIDTLECRAGEWKILHRVATTEWVKRNLPEQQWPIPAQLRRGSRDRQDPIYKAWD